MMAVHEIACIRRRLDRHHEQLVIKNALESTPRAEWLDGARGVIFGGSGDFSVHHVGNRHWVRPLQRLIDVTLARGLPGFGICFGHQLLGEVLGARVVTCRQRSEIGTVRVRLTADGQRDPLFTDLGEHFPVHTGHTDCVTTIPRGVTLLAESEALVTQAFRATFAPFWSTQFHPDLTGAEARQRYLAYRDVLTSAADAAEAERLALRFTPGEDAAASLLRQFCDRVVAGTIREQPLVAAP